MKVPVGTSVRKENDNENNRNEVTHWNRIKTSNR